MVADFLGSDGVRVCVEGVLDTDSDHADAYMHAVDHGNADGKRLAHSDAIADGDALTDGDANANPTPRPGAGCSRNPRVPAAAGRGRLSERGCGPTDA